ncbi:hypothetical protein NMY22_g12792 [Coprinellus aureogranulatus]|nr:hypothetical protein NMY22_g12792 [Coprinellus aureogranulatus]
MASKHFFQCTELVLEVAQNLSNIESEQSRQTSLQAMALTSKACFMPVMEILWKHITGLEPILRCLPDDIWYCEEDHEARGTLVPNSLVQMLSRRILYEDAARVLEIYCPLIRGLRIEEWPRSVTIDNLVNSRLHHRDPLQDQTSLKNDILCPQLQLLHFNCGSGVEASERIRFLPHFTSPTLQELEFHFPDSRAVNITATAFSEAFMHIVADCPALERVSLKINVDLSSRRLSGIIREVVTRHWKSCLGMLEIRNLTNTDLEYLSTLPNLHTLVITDLGLLKCWYKYEPNAPQAPRRSKDSAFPGLKTLRISTTHLQGNFSNLMAVLQYLSPDNTALDTLFIQSDPACSSLNGWKGVIAMIATHCNKDSLTSLSLGDNLLGRIKHKYPARSQGHLDLSPLFSFPNIASFLHHVGAAQPIRGEELRRMAAAWVNLHSLSLPRFRDSLADADRMDCDDLIYLSQTLPHLTRLSVSTADLGKKSYGTYTGRSKPRPMGVVAPLECVEFVNTVMTCSVTFLDFYTTAFVPLPQLMHSMVTEPPEYLGYWVEVMSFTDKIRSGELGIEDMMMDILCKHSWFPRSDSEEEEESSDESDSHSRGSRSSELRRG